MDATAGEHERVGSRWYAKLFSRLSSLFFIFKFNAKRKRKRILNQTYLTSRFVFCMELTAFLPPIEIDFARGWCEWPQSHSLHSASLSSGESFELRLIDRELLITDSPIKQQSNQRSIDAFVAPHWKSISMQTNISSYRSLVRARLSVNIFESLLTRNVLMTSHFSSAFTFFNRLCLFRFAFDWRRRKV